MLNNGNKLVTGFLNRQLFCISSYGRLTCFIADILVIKRRRMRWAGHVTCVEKVVAPCSLVQVYQRFRYLLPPEDSHLRTHHRENLKSSTGKIIYAYKILVVNHE
jgi:hypothetical protein